MRFKTRHIPSRPGKPAKPITAKGPQDCIALTPEEFAGATSYVAKAFLSAAILPSKQFFSGANVTGLLSSDSAKRTLLASYAHFDRDPNKSLSFFMRFTALLHLSQACDLSAWVELESETSEYAAYSTDLLALAARHPLLASGAFDQTSFLAQLRSLELVDNTGTDLQSQGSSIVAQPEPERLAA